MIESHLREYAFRGKALLILGPRQVGKTTLMEKLVSDVPPSDFLVFSGDYPGDRRSLEFDNRVQMERIIGDAKWILIDEGQKIPDIGNKIKVIVDHFKNTKQVIVTGSSSIGILDYTSEPLTGRKQVFHLFPIAFPEVAMTHSLLTAERSIEEFLLYGMYPDILMTVSEKGKIERLKDIVSGQLYRDVLEFGQVKHSDVITKLLELLALNIGQEVSYNKLAQILGVSQNTVERYIDLLEKSFIIFRLRAYSRNKKKEITKMKKIYFYDLGIRNSLLKAFSPLSLRGDVGVLFENFFIAERQKRITYDTLPLEGYFWRTLNQEEVDYLEVGESLQRAYECKWQEKSYRPPRAFSELYPNISVSLVNRENVSSFI